MLKELEILLTSPKIHVAIILSLALEDQRVEPIINTLDYYTLKLWERGMPCSLEDAATAIVERTDLNKFPVVVSDEIRKEILMRIHKE